MKKLPRIAYKLNEAAQVVGVSDKTFSIWMKGENPPPHVRRSRTILFLHEDLIQWLRDQTRCGTLPGNNQSDSIAENQH